MACFFVADMLHRGKLKKVRTRAIVAVFLQNLHGTVVIEFLLQNILAFGR